MSRRRTSRSVGRRLTAVVVVAVAAAVVPLGAWVPSAQAATTGLALTGHGWGAGVGMGQWGAFGDAVDGMPYTAILGHFYGGTSLQTLTAAQDATEVRVAMVENDGSSAIVTSASPFTVAGVSVAAGQAAMLQPLPGDVWDVYVSGSCAGGSSGWGAPVVSNVTDPTAVPSSDPPLGDPSAPDLVLQLCEPSGTLPVRGDIEGVFNANNDARTVNILPLEQYVASVVPNESYAYWGSLGGPGPQGQDWGFQALEAQAVAARSFVMAGLGSYGGYADVCDIGCQSYRGLDNASPLTDLATTDTAGEVLELANGSIASTQYSASTGGYTAPSAFPAVPDAGDAVCLPQACNPNHTWSVTVPASSIEAAWPQIGTFVAIDITARNGLGDWGGRVTQLTVEGTTGSVQVSGDTFAGTLGLRSDWFTPTLVLAKPAVGMAATSDGGGYHLVASDGGIFSFGDAQFYGSMGGAAPPSPCIVPPANPTVDLSPDPNFLDACYQDAASDACANQEVEATNAARAAEGIGPLQLPTDFAALSPAEQLFVVTDVERVDRGLPPFVGLDATLDSDAAAAAAVNADPSPAPAPPGMSVIAWGGNWAENANALGASYYWLYDDGLGSSNLDCSPASPACCWGHRDNELGLAGDQASYGGTLVMGAAEDTGPNHGGWASLTELTVLASGPLPPLVYTWAQAVAAGAG